MIDNRKRIVVIESDATIRDGYDYLLNRQPEFKVINTYSSMAAALKNIYYDSATVFLLDISLAPTNGIDVVKEIKQKMPMSIILLLTMYEDTEMISTLLLNGATSYLSKNSPIEKMVDLIKRN